MCIPFSSSPLHSTTMMPCAAALHTLALTFAAVSVSSAGSRLHTACAAPLVTRKVVPPAAWMVASVRCVFITKRGQTYVQNKQNMFTTSGASIAEVLWAEMMFEHALHTGTIRPSTHERQPHQDRLCTTQHMLPHGEEAQCTKCMHPAPCTG